MSVFNQILTGGGGVKFATGEVSTKAVPTGTSDEYWAEIKVHGLKFKPKAIALAPNDSRYCFYTITIYDDKDAVAAHVFTKYNSSTGSGPYGTDAGFTTGHVRYESMVLFDDGFESRISPRIDGRGYVPTKCTWYAVG